MDDAASEHVWREHELWLRLHWQSRIDREAWTPAEWDKAKRLADAAWRIFPSGLYLYAAEEAMRDVHNLRVADRRRGP